jgi:predicted RNase H-like HicB family nuclease
VEVSSFGDTPDEARAAIREALELYFEDDLTRGVEVNCTVTA